MKRYGHIIEEITARGNLCEAFDTVVRGTERKRMSEGRWLIAHHDEFLKDVAEEIRTGHVELGKWHERVITEAGKVRHLQVFDMKARIKVAAVMIITDKYLRKRFIRTTGSSIKNRGVHDLKAYIERDLREHPEIKFWYKFDIRKFYDTVRQDFVKWCVRRVFKDAVLISLLDEFVSVMPDGISISMGMRSSQGLGNLLLSVFLDHYLKDRYGIRFYYRYCDDGVCGSETKIDLWECSGFVHAQVEFIGQQVKYNDRVFPVEEGLDFLGYVIFPTHTLMRKRVKKSYARKLARVKSRKRRHELVASFCGMAKHADCKNLMKKLLTKKEMQEFSQMGLSYTPQDGKKRFKGESVRLSSIVNTKIEIHDYEKDVSTKNGKRTLVYFRDPADGQFKKFFTASEEMTFILDEVRKRTDGFPFLATIRCEPYDEGKMHYKFT
ncbi:MAG: hypothetical protein PUG74_08780 [Prevotellaceae bacterium]|nr:hypothetical protein [Prevotellaceae bacterium]